MKSQDQPNRIPNPPREIPTKEYPSPDPGGPRDPQEIPQK